MRKYFVIFLISIVAILLAYLYGIRQSFTNKTSTVNASVVIEEIRKVNKLVSIEAELSELYSYKDYLNWDVSFLRKKALVRINAKVLAGFDLENMGIYVDSINHHVVISHFPDAEILSIDHDLDYYDITEGTFNSFSADDSNQINKKSNETTREKAIESGVLNRVNERKKDIENMLKGILSAMGYSLEIKRMPTPSVRN